jgi:bacillithiol system protein YtxJ
MHPDLTHVQHLEELDVLLADQTIGPLLLFKHSLSCGTSYEALDELIDHLNEDRLPGALRDDHRADAIASSPLPWPSGSGVRHETPQALLIREGRVVWSASHFRVTGGALETAIKQQIRPRRDNSAAARNNAGDHSAVEVALATGEDLQRPYEFEQSPGCNRKSGFVGLPRAACARVNVSYTSRPSGASASINAGKSGRCR